jgi:hypothetical protein
LKAHRPILEEIAAQTCTVGPSRPRLFPSPTYKEPSTNLITPVFPEIFPPLL